MRNIDPTMDTTVVAEIDRKLQTIRDAHSVRIPWAIESGSRAWGFPSPDSDYDCRFVFIRPLNDTLALFPKRDVIEIPIDPIYDVGGWELGKALKLLLKGNAVIIEWLTSPLIYNGEELFKNEFLNLAEQVTDRGMIANHYLRLAISMREKTLKNEAEVALKKLFYILRPLVALEWLRNHPSHNVAPMHFPTLMQETGLPKDFVQSVEDLIALKSETRELGKGAIPIPIASYIESAFEQAETDPISPMKANSEKVNLAEAFHLKWVTAR